MKMEKFDLIIVGGGPAGLTAAIYAVRSGLNTAFIEADAPGGKLTLTNEISNWPGIEETHGADLALSMFNHATALGAKYIYGRVNEIKEHEYGKEVISDQDSYLAHAVIVATGTKERLLGIENEVEFAGRGVSYCAVCDGGFTRGKDIIVIGGGNSAFEETIYLAGLAKSITIVVRKDKARAEAKIVQQVEALDNVTILYNHDSIAMGASDNHINGLTVHDRINDKTYTLDGEMIFPYIGSDPITNMLDGVVDLDARNYVIANNDMETSVAGIFSAGDINQKTLRQVVTAASDGAIAAQSAFNYIKENF